MENKLPVIIRTTEESVESVPKAGIPGWGIAVIVLLCLFIVLAIVAIILVLVQQRKKTETVQTAPVAKTPIARTEKIRPQVQESLVEDNHSNHTKKLWENGSSSQASKKIRLFVQDIARPENQFKVSCGRGVVVGRRDGDINVVYDKFISSVHCRITCENGILYVEDLKSANGTFYENEKIIGKIPVINGSIIKVGKTELRVEIKGETD